MQLDELINKWSKDSIIDATELATESLNTPQVHNKYLMIFMAERVKYRKFQIKCKKMKKMLIEYYLGEMTQEELKALGRDQMYKKVLKSELDLHLESDEMMIAVNLEMCVQREKVEYLESIIKSINNRGFQIKNAIDFMRFQNGA